MNFAALEDQFRRDTTDTETPYLCSHEDVVAWLNEAEREAALRANLLHEADNDDVCEIAVTAGVPAYELHDKVIRITYATFTPEGSDTPIVLNLTNRQRLNQNRPYWRTQEEEPRDLIQEQRKVRFGCIPSCDGTLRIECFRYPLEDMADDDDSPEIAEAHHLQLVQWALFRAYSRPTIELYDEKAAVKALAEFERVFGLRPDAALGQDVEDAPHVTTAYVY